MCWLCCEALKLEYYTPGSVKIKKVPGLVLGDWHAPQLRTGILHESLGAMVDAWVLTASSTSDMLARHDLCFAIWAVSAWDLPFNQ